MRIQRFVDIAVEFNYDAMSKTGTESIFAFQRHQKQEAYLSQVSR